jgi:hypothetical protein
VHVCRLVEHRIAVGDLDPLSGHRVDRVRARGPARAGEQRVEEGPERRPRKGRGRRFSCLGAAARLLLGRPLGRERASPRRPLQGERNDQEEEHREEQKRHGKRRSHSANN